jgi:hypothetical protein
VTLREAAEQREAAVRRALEAQRALAALRQGAEEAACQEAETQRELAVREQAARRRAEAQRDAALQRAADAQRELAALRESMERGEAAAPAGQPSDPSSTIARQLALRTATDRAVPFVAAGNSIVQARDKAVSTGAETASSGREERRRDRRAASQVPGSLWVESKQRSLACTIRNRSSNGARLEVAPGAFGEGITELAVGNRLSLTFDAGQERTSVGCVVMWVAGNSCGVRFAGQFQTQVSNLKKSAKSMTGLESIARSTKPTQDGTRRRSIFRAD